MRKIYIQSMAKIASRGVFWYIDGELVSFPYYENYEGVGLAKSGSTFNHKKLWPEICPKKYRKYPFNYFPRGRVDFSNKQKPIIYMNPNIPESAVSDIKIDFGLRDNPKLFYDYSNHYRCYLDEGWKPDK